MKSVVKKEGNRTKAYKLGQEHPVLERLIKEKKIIDRNNGTFEVMSQEAVKGKSGHGQMAKVGDYIKVDSEGFPYPNDTEYFELNHRWIKDDEYEQLPKKLNAWTSDEPMCKEIEFLIQHKGLVIKENNFEEYFTAPLWGTIEKAAKDAVVIFYTIEYQDNGSVANADFNFVKRSEFNKTYRICEEEEV